MNRKVVSPQQKVPLYVRVASDILEAAKGMAPHSLLPSEPALVRKYGVSRGTVKQALDQLEHEGVVYRKQGKGTFVAEPRILRHSHSVPSFSDDIRRRGLIPSIECLSLTRREPSERVCTALSIGPEIEVWVAKRIFLANGKPLALVTSFLPVSIVDSLSAVDVEYSLYSSLERRYGWRPAWASDSYASVLAAGEVAERLRVKKGDPIIYSERVAYLADMRPVEYVESSINAARFTIFVDWMPADSDSESIWTKLNREEPGVKARR